MKKRNSKKLSLSEKKRLEAAEKSFHEMWEEVKPFVKKRRIIQYSTTGEWITSIG